MIRQKWKPPKGSVGSAYICSLLWLKKGCFYRRHDSPIIAYQLEGSPIRQTFYTPLAFAPLIKRGILRPAPDSKFPIIAYHQNGKPFRQGVEEDGHIWWDICECETCYWNAQETEWELQMERERRPNKEERKSPLRRKRKVWKRWPLGRSPWWTYREVWILRSLLEKGTVAETTTQTPPLGEDQVSIPFTESSSQNRNNPSEASSATPLPKPIVESPPGGYYADTEYSIKS